MVGEKMKRIVKLLIVCLVIAGCGSCKESRTTRDSWYTGFPSQPPWCDDQQHQIHKQRILPVSDIHLDEACALLADVTIVEIDLAQAQRLVGIPDLSQDKLLRDAASEAKAEAEASEKRAQALSEDADVFRREATAQRAAAKEAEDLLGKLKPYLVRAVVLWEGTGAFSAYWKDSSLWIHHGCLGRSAAPMKRRPLVVLLEKKPISVYNSVSMAE